MSPLPFLQNDLYGKVLMSEPNIHSDFSRLARWLTGNSVGLVLGGGGARGAAHVGMLKAIQEAGIPIDMVGGVSIGAFMGALFCAEKNITTVTQKARAWCNVSGSGSFENSMVMSLCFAENDKLGQATVGSHVSDYVDVLWKGFQQDDPRHVRGRLHRGLVDPVLYSDDRYYGQLR